MNKIILDLCGGTGAWSAPYKAAGYDVRVITLPEHDILTYKPPRSGVYGIMAAPPLHDVFIGAQHGQNAAGFSGGNANRGGMPADHMGCAQAAKDCILGNGKPQGISAAIPGQAPDEL